MPASAPARLKPEIVTVLAVPTSALAKVPVAVPARATPSPLTAPASPGVPASVAVVVPSYTLF